MSANYIKKALVSTTALVTSENSESVELDGGNVGTVTVVHGANASAVVVPSAAIDATANTFTLAAHGLVTGTVGQFTTSSALPTGISALTNYFIIKISADIFKVATSYANAIAGTAVDFSTAGVGNQTFTLLAKSVSIQAQVTNVADPASADWVNKGLPVSIVGTSAGATSLEYEEKELAYSKYRLVTTHTSGQFALSCILNLKT